MKNVIVTGGELFNKGAQAMTFVAVDELKKRFPSHEIYLLSTEDLKRPQKEREIYDFKFMGWFPLKFAKAQSDLFLRCLCMLRNREELKKCEEIYRNCDLMVDISGYALGSNWNEKNCNNYLDHIEFAKAFKIPMYLMPQSFGPFNYCNGTPNYVKRIQRLLPTVKQICAREREGFDQLVDIFSLNNVVLLPDLVMNNKSINLDNVFSIQPPIYELNINPNSVGVIPNGMTVKFSNMEKVLKVFYVAISHILSEGNHVYILSHATNDLELCSKIKSLFEDDDRVILIDQDLNCIEFNNIVRQFDFVIASRFHAIVHSFKNGTPCIALGWAVKYHDLLRDFKQEEYSFDVCEDIDIQVFKDKITKMKKNVQNESAVILEHLENIQRENVFDILRI